MWFVNLVIVIVRLSFDVNFYAAILQMIVLIYSK